MFSDFGLSECKEHNEHNELIFAGVQASTAWFSDVDSMRKLFVMTSIALRRVFAAILALMRAYTGVCV